MKRQHSHITGSLSSPIKPHSASRLSTKLENFEMLDFLGNGSFAKVYQVLEISTSKKYAMKIISKALMMREKKKKYVMVERNVLIALNHPNIISLYITFQDAENLYFVLEYAANKDLQHLLSDIYAISVPCTKILLAQLILALSHMHSRKIMHRDLKPENILLDKYNRVRLSDFGSARIFDKDEEFRASRGSFVGSADYVPPEVLIDKPIGPSSDLWSFGCILYAMLVGEAPFHSESNYIIFKKIQALQYTIPDFIPEEAKDLITKLLVLDPEQRLGNGTYMSDYEPIRSHPFFANIEWDSISTQQIETMAAFQPAVDYKINLIQQMRKEQENSGEENIVKDIKVFSTIGDKTTQLCLILTDRPRLFLTDFNANDLQCEIMLSPDLKMNLSLSSLEITTNGDTFNLEFMEAEDAYSWNQMIQGIISDDY